MPQDSFDSINASYMDILKELGNIGAGNATTSLAFMLDQKIDMTVPKVQLLSFQELGSAISAEEEPVVGVYLEVQSDITGSMMFVTPLKSAQYLVSCLMKKPLDYDIPFSEIDKSALKEMGNIITGAYLCALSTLTNLTITTSVPYLAVDMAAAILSVPAIQFGQYGDNAMLIETKFGNEMIIDGYFILLPDLKSYGKILKSLGIAD